MEATVEGICRCCSQTVMAIWSPGSWLRTGIGGYNPLALVGNRKVPRERGKEEGDMVMWEFTVEEAEHLCVWVRLENGRLVWLKELVFSTKCVFTCIIFPANFHSHLALSLVSILLINSTTTIWSQDFFRRNLIFMSVHLLLEIILSACVHITSLMYMYNTMEYLFLIPIFNKASKLKNNVHTLVLRRVTGLHPIFISSSWTEFQLFSRYNIQKI